MPIAARYTRDAINRSGLNIFLHCETGPLRKNVLMKRLSIKNNNIKRQKMNKVILIKRRVLLTRNGAVQMFYEIIFYKVQ